MLDKELFMFLNKRLRHVRTPLGFICVTTHTPFVQPTVLPHHSSSFTVIEKIH